MPNELVLVRHGQAQGNLAREAARAGDGSWFTEAYATTPGHRWRLTDLGRAQAAAAGGWIRAAITPRFDQYYVSPFVRARETAGHLDLPDARWLLNRALRERDWGDIGSLARADFESRPEYALNAMTKRTDPLYWCAPNGESIAHVAEDRVRNVLSTLHREATGQKVVAVTHGEAMGAFRLVLERMDDEQFAAADADPSQHIHNGEVLHYSRIDPDTGLQAGRLAWLRRAWPVESDDGLVVEVGPWRHIDYTTASNDDLLRQVSGVPELRPAAS